MDIVDHAGHSDGPDSTEVEKQLRNADYYVGILMEGLKQRNLENCVNMIFVADHGESKQGRRNASRARGALVPKI